MSIVHGGTGGDSVGFLAVASRSPEGCVVERKICESCSAPFYRPAPMRADLGEKYCAKCRAVPKPEPQRRIDGTRSPGASLPGEVPLRSKYFRRAVQNERRAS